MQADQLKLKIDYLILDCRILENDIFTDHDSYYKWILIKVNAKISQTSNRVSSNINFIVIMVAVVSLIVSMISMINSYQDENVTYAFGVILLFSIILIAFILIFLLLKLLEKTAGKKQ